MGAEPANRTMGQVVMFVVVVAISVSIVYLWYTNEDFRNTVDYLYDKMNLLFGWGESDDAQIAVDSTKALACAIDVTAYWSSQDSNKLGTRLSYIDDPTQPGAPVRPTLFQKLGASDDKQGDWFASCVGDLSGYGVFTPTFSAITTNSGGILGKLSEWSGGDNKITGRFFETPEDCNIDGIDTCASEDGPANTYVCDKEAENVVCCEKDLIDKDVYCCDSGYYELEGQCVEMSTKQLEGDADEIVADHPGTAMRFGRTAVVCDKAINAGETVAPFITPCLIIGKRMCGTDGNIYVCPILAPPMGVRVYVKAEDCGGIGCTYTEGGPFCAVPDALDLQCTVKAFELPQRIDGDIIDAAAKWVGVFGEPKYTVYHETFPIGIEGVWKYDSMSAVLATVALGGFMNLGGGVLKASKTAIMTTSKGLTLAVLKKEGLRAALSKGHKAGLERLTLEYGGETALKKILARKFSSSFHGVPQIETKISSTLTEGMLKKSADAVGDEITTIKGVYDLLPLMQQEKFMADMALLVRSSGDDVPSDSLLLMLDDTGVEKTLEVHSKSLNQIKLLDDITTMKTAWKKQADPTAGPDEKLLTEDMEAGLKAAMVKEISSDAGVRAIVDKSAKDGFKMFRNLRGLSKTPGYKKAFEKNMRAEAGEIAEMSYDDVLSKTYDLKKACGDCAGTYIDEVYGETYSALEKEGGEGVIDGMNTLKDDADALLSGMTGQKRGDGLISPNLQKAAMVGTLAISYLAMTKDANLEKYKSCGQGQVCLHYPKWFAANRGLDAGSTFGFGEGSDVKAEYNDLVSLAGFSEDQTLRMHLISPCKTDLTVASSASACKCETFYGQDIIAYRIDKIACVLDANGNGKYDGEPEKIPVDLKADGQCPTTYVLTEKFIRIWDPPLEPDTYDVLTITYAPSAWTLLDVSDDFGPFEDCPVIAGEDIIDTLQNCVDEKLYDDDNNLRAPYKQCAEDLAGACKQFWQPEYVIMQVPPVYTKLSQTLNAFPVPLNIIPNVDDEKPAETISVCENSWLGGFLDIAEDAARNCITVTPDASSMGDYSEAGFGTNYCATNENTFWKNAADTCFWGSIALSLGIEVVSAGGLTPVVLYVVGSGAVACEKIAEMDSKWPKNQFG